MHKLVPNLCVIGSELRLNGVSEAVMDGRWAASVGVRFGRCVWALVYESNHKHQAWLMA